MTEREKVFVSIGDGEEPDIEQITETLMSALFPPPDDDAR